MPSTLPLLAQRCLDAFKPPLDGRLQLGIAAAGVAMCALAGVAVSAVGTAPVEVAATAPLVSCADQVWPYIDSTCNATAGRPTRQVRVVSTDRNAPVRIVSMAAPVRAPAPAATATATPQALPAPVQRVATVAPVASRPAAEPPRGNVKTVTVRDGRRKTRSATARTYRLPAENPMRSFAFVSPW
jgi:hypothetical protein